MEAMAAALGMAEWMPMMALAAPATAVAQAPVMRAVVTAET